jgi:hypothetical protein
MTDLSNIPVMAQVFEVCKQAQGSGNEQLIANATSAQQYLMALHNNQLSAAEFADLMQDLHDKVEAADAADAIASKVMLAHALNLAISVAGSL